MKWEDRKIYPDKKEFIKMELDKIKDSFLKTLDKLPNKELPFMEPHLRALYFETYFLLAQEFYNASLVLMGILLENIVKEKLFIEGVKDEELEEMNFGHAINKCEKILSNQELEFLKKKKEELRNPYAHYNKMKLSKGIYFPSWKIPSEEIAPRLIALDKRVKKGELTESQARKELIRGIKPELMSSKEFRPMAQIAKSEKEKRSAIDIFLEINKFTREFAKKYFNKKRK